MSKSSITVKQVVYSGVAIALATVIATVIKLVIIAAYFHCFPSLRTNTKEVFL